MGLTSKLLSRRQKGIIKLKVASNSPAPHKIGRTEGNYGRRLNKLSIIPAELNFSKTQQVYNTQKGERLQTSTSGNR